MKTPIKKVVHVPGFEKLQLDFTEQEKIRLQLESENAGLKENAERDLQCNLQSRRTSERQLAGKDKEIEGLKETLEGLEHKARRLEQELDAAHFLFDVLPNVSKRYKDAEGGASLAQRFVSFLASRSK